MILRSRYRQITMIYVVLISALVCGVIIDRQILYPDRQFPQVDNAEVLIYLAFLCGFSFLLFFRETRQTQIVQILLLIGLGIAVVTLIAPKELGGDLNFLLAAALAYKYGLFNTRPMLKLSSVIGTLAISRSIVAIIRDDISVGRVLNQLVIVSLAIPIVYWLFEDELIRTRREKRRLERLQQSNQPFVEFGRNVSGIVHDFKNDLGLLHTFGQYLDFSAGEPIEMSLVNRYKGYVDRIAMRIRRILMVTQASHQATEKRILLQDLVRSTLYVFQSNLEFKRIVIFDVVLEDRELYATMQPAPLISILENLIRNSCEALVETYGAESPPPGKATVTVKLHTRNDNVEIVIADNGPGISFCESCRYTNCLDCPNFAIGKSEKKGGSGIGMFNIRHAARQLDIDVHLTSSRSRGVVATVLIPMSRIEADNDIGRTLSVDA